ncbi:MAG: 7-cyano-7-deazaguanine synthase QueC [Planctomycetota bacterium]|nr:MAG: 7-cyano-7-deazaguanine synthase QueC [Planctomycetota bacterium]
MGSGEDTSRKAVVLLSGGLDSTTVAAWLAREGWKIHALSVDYGQRHAVELSAARRLAARLGVAEHLVLPLDLRGIGGSALTADRPVPKEADPLAPVAAGIPDTYVPARNTILLALALALAEARGAGAIGIGVNALDYSGYPDCRPEFVAAFAELARLATREGVEGRPVRILAPLQHLRKAEILTLARRLGVPVAETVSCYDPDPGGGACGGCDACRLRARAERELAAPVEVAVDAGGSGPRAEARLSGRPVGWAALRADPAGDWRLEILEVAPEARDLGAAPRLLRALQRFAGTGSIRVAAAAAEPEVLRSCGFRPAGRGWRWQGPPPAALPLDG